MAQSYEKSPTGTVGARLRKRGSLRVTTEGGTTEARLGWGTGLLGVGVALLAFALYLVTLAPTVLYYEDPTMYDPAMLQAEARVLGVGHPSGYPTYMMLTKLFTYLPVGDVAYRVNLASAVYGGVAVFVVYLVGLRLCGRGVAAATGALAFGVSQTFWSQATLAEVYTLNAVFIALVLLTLLVWRDTRRDRYLLAAAFLVGLSLTHHLTSGLLLTAGLAFVFLVDRGKLRDWRLVSKGAGLFLVGLLPYLYLPIRATMEASLNEADPSSPTRFLLLVTASSYLLKLLTDQEQPQANDAAGSEEFFARLSSSAEHLSGQYPILLVLVGAVGIHHLVRADRAAAVLSGVPFLGWLVHALTNGVKDFYVFLIPAYLIFALWIAVGTSVLLRTAEVLAQNSFSTALRKVAPIALLALAFAVLLLGAWGNYEENDRGGDYRGRRIVEAVVENAAPNATILHHRSPLWYMVLVERRRQDLTLVDPFKTSWIRFNDIVWPEPLTRAEADARYDLDDTTGVAAAREAARSGPVYVLDPDSLDPDEAGLRFFRDAGFDVVRAGEGGELYELVPPGREPRG